MLETLGVRCRDVDRGVQREPVHVRTQGRGSEACSRSSLNTDPPKLRTRIRALGDSTLDRGGLEEGQQALLFVSIADRRSALVGQQPTTAHKA